ncbi:30S ribosome-binding factor RbfA [Natronospira bacteriovora]|uniref:Ribosome-binding factor A n=1 Tax=Natronospira bacteriovora TaxID=3069753 RepID=A0ABU0W543_9GAMM|nr:30S ribosome-binding factor RbfA [Natronospira sp. AB-CW4]MDQ2069146.1 30S ribosome-binding factor RbfA [Natronospira sp. AB-CW4]
MKEPSKPGQRKLAEDIKRRLSLIMREEVQHDAAWQITVTDVEVARDLSRAKVWVDFLGEPPEALIEAMEAARNSLRARLGRTMNIRKSPQIVFVHDDSLKRGAHLSALIEKAVDQDRRRRGDDEDGEESDGGR